MAKRQRIYGKIKIIISTYKKSDFYRLITSFLSVNVITEMRLYQYLLYVILVQWRLVLFQTHSFSYFFINMLTFRLLAYHC